MAPLWKRERRGGGGGVCSKFRVAEHKSFHFCARMKQCCATLHCTPNAALHGAPATAAVFVPQNLGHLSRRVCCISQMRRPFWGGAPSCCNKMRKPKIAASRPRCVAASLSSLLSRGSWLGQSIAAGSKQQAAASSSSSSCRSAVCIDKNTQVEWKRKLLPMGQVKYKWQQVASGNNSNNNATAS